MIVLHFASILLGVAFAAVAGAAQADIKTQWVEYTYGGAQLKGYLAYDDAITGRRPGVLMVHRRDGMSALTLKNTEMYAKLGYVAFAPDIYGYGQGVLPKDIPEMQTLQAQYEKDRSVTLGRAQAGLHVGDAILTWDGGEVPRRPSRWVMEQNPGDTLALRIRREDKELSLEFRLGEMKETAYEVSEDAHATDQARRIREGLLRGEASSAAHH